MRIEDLLKKYGFEVCKSGVHRLAVFYGYYGELRLTLKEINT